MPFLAAALCLTAAAAPQSEESASELGFLPPGDPIEASRAYLLSRAAAVRATEADDFLVASSHGDDLDRVHVRFHVERDGLRVYRAQTIVQSHAKSGAVLALRSNLASTFQAPVSPQVPATKALEQALDQAQLGKAVPLTAPELCYLLAPRPSLTEEAGPAPALAWRQLVDAGAGAGFVPVEVFADALSGHLLSAEGLAFEAKDRRTFDGLGSTSFAGLPGLLRRAEGEAPVGDACLDAAHELTGEVYDFFLQRFGRDSWDGAGGRLDSTVDWGSECGALFVWSTDLDLNQAAFGRGATCQLNTGEVVEVACTGLDPDIVAHEWSHGVILSSSGLSAGDEARAMNESLADVFAAAKDAWLNGTSPGTWIVGETAYWPGDPGRGLRYLSDPQLDGSSFDHLPTLQAALAGGATPTPHNAGGVGNLAFFLLSEGGMHPRGTTDTLVLGIGVHDAARVFYRATVDYLLPTAGWVDLRRATLDAAADLFGLSSFPREQVRLAWEAVGVLPPNDCQDARPCAVTARATGASTAVVEWHDPVPNESGFRVRHRQQDTSAWTVTPVAADVTMLAVGGLAAQTSYEFEVRTLFPDGSKSAYSDRAVATTLDGAAGTAGPSGLTASASAVPTAVLVWQDNSNVESRFRIRRQRLAPDPEATPVVIANVPPDTTLFEDLESLPGATYSYQVRALFDGAPASPYTTAATLTLPGAFAGGTPTDLTLTRTGKASIFTAWIDRSEGELEFELQRRPTAAPDDPWTAIQVPGAAGVGKVVNHHDEIEGATPGQSFDYRVRGLLPEGGATPFSELRSMTTALSTTAGGGAGPQLQVKPPAKDGYVAENAPQGNFGDRADLLIHTMDGLGRHAYLGFELTLPAGAVVNGAYLDFSVLSDQSFDSLGVWFCQDNSWSETGVSWLNQPWDPVHLVELVQAVPGAGRVVIDVGDEVTGPGSFTFGLATSAHALQCLSSREGLAPPVLRVFYDAP
ncbi:MAG: M4 family metallopeptidase [Planctomycetota bacterium]